MLVGSRQRVQIPFNTFLSRNGPTQITTQISVTIRGIHFTIPKRFVQDQISTAGARALGAQHRNARGVDPKMWRHTLRSGLSENLNYPIGSCIAHYLQATLGSVLSQIKPCSI